MSLPPLSIHTMTDSERSDLREDSNLPNENVIDYDNIPMRAINSSTRLKLSQLLNVQQALTNTKNVARDYRGLAELMGFEYIDIRNFERCKDPTKEIIEEWEVKPQSSVGALVKIVDNLERYDILDEIQPLLSENVKSWINKRLESDSESDNNWRDGSNSNFSKPYPPDVIHPLSATDNELNKSFYHAYVCYSDNDLDFVRQLSEHLEAPEIGLKLFIRERDLALGVLQYDTYLRLIEERCKRVLVILSPEFFESPECEFQAKFAAGLGIDQRSNKIIPIIYKACSIPSMLSCLSKVDFSRRNDYNFKWNWEKLVRSLGGTPIASTTVRTDNAATALPIDGPFIPINGPDILQISNSTTQGLTVPHTEIVPVAAESGPNGALALPSKESAISNSKKTKTSKPKWLNTIVTKVSSGFHSKEKSTKAKTSSF